MIPSKYTIIPHSNLRNQFFVPDLALKLEAKSVDTSYADTKKIAFFCLYHKSDGCRSLHEATVRCRGKLIVLV